MRSLAIEISRDISLAKMVVIQAIRERLDLSVMTILFLVLVLLIYGSQKDENLVFKAVVTKLNLYIKSISFMILAKDNKGVGPKKNPDPDTVKEKVSQGLTKKKRIIFIRHGESDWNNIFNKGFGFSFPVR